MRNLLLLIGGSVMLLFTSAKLTGLVFLVVPLVVFPIIIFGRKVRKLSRESQDRIADVGSFVDEALSAIRTVQAYGHEARNAAISPTGSKTRSTSRSSAYGPAPP